MSSAKVMIILLTVGLIKKISLYKMSYFIKSYTLNKNKIKVEFDFFNYSTKFDLKHATGVDISNFAKKHDLAGLNSKVD